MTPPQYNVLVILNLFQDLYPFYIRPRNKFGVTGFVFDLVLENMLILTCIMKLSYKSFVISRRANFFSASSAIQNSATAARIKIKVKTPGETPIHWSIRISPL